MGSEDLFYKRKAKTKNVLARKKNRRAPYERVLIVCEGAKTEPYYFQELIDCLELNTANVVVDGSCDSSPNQVVAFAIKKYRTEIKTGNGFDKVFCVIDRDAHNTYENALTRIQNLKPKGVFSAINSVPCFEYWLLLHFEFTTRPFVATGAKSSCDNLIDSLSGFIPDYAKGEKNIYSGIAHQTNQAINWSKRALKQAKYNATNNPATYVHELVEYLQNLKNQ
ncbi:hypothetical protein MNBD_GAMMA10-2138 [hydrothermal vent metagenome]|uniref:CRISPR-associated protein n=1 Tax=hydrothermal vent metagenome TaxID=652676 RepID=A0A3B0XHT5_9ZZZZ